MHLPGIWKWKRSAAGSVKRSRSLRILPVQEPEKTDSGESTARYGWRCIDGLSSGRSGDIFREGKKSCLKSIVEEMRYQIRVSLYGYSWRCCAEKKQYRGMVAGSPNSLSGTL